MTITVIIPTLNEERVIGRTLAHTGRLGFDAVTVVDGGSTDRTREIVEAAMAPVGHRMRLVTSPKGRARQLNAGAAVSESDVLLFLHADTQLPDNAREVVVKTLGDSTCVGGRFDVRFDAETVIAHTVARFMNLRSRLSGISTGDQALFVRRRVFEDLGRFADIPLMEDIEFAHRLKRAGTVTALHDQVITAYRRWQAQGPIRTILLMWTLRFLYWLGVSPFTLHKMYQAVR